MNLEKAIKIITANIYRENGEHYKYIDVNNYEYQPEDEKCETFIQAIETMLQALKNSIPRKRIEDEIKELELELELRHFKREAEMQIRLLQKLLKKR